MPNRIIKESIRTSKKINAMTDFQFRFWTYLITFADDYGRGIADPEIIKGFVFPRLNRLRESDIVKTLAELADMGAVKRYEVGGTWYFELSDWDFWQPESGRKTPDYKQWRLSVFHRDGFACQACRRIGGKLNAHHIKRYAKEPSLRTVIENGITLCDRCHRDIHSKEGH